MNIFQKKEPLMQRAS